MSYGYKMELELDFEKAIEKARAELQKEGFGVLTEINVKSTLKEKLDVDYENYIILGACNPPFAHKALQAEKEIGLLLPCNVIIYSKNGKTIISAINPTEVMSIINNPKLKAIAEEVEKKLKKTIDAISMKGGGIDGDSKTE
jgi:uncharacterized protein (DUF302 family)